MQAAGAMCVGSVVGLCLWLCTSVFVVPVNVVSIVIGAVYADTCDNTDPIPLGTWLIVEGAVGIGIYLLSCPAFLACICTVCYAGCFTILAEMWTIAWIVVGGLVLFQEDGLDCKEGVLWIYSCVIWCLCVLSIFFYCCNCVTGVCQSTTNTAASAA